MKPLQIYEGLKDIGEKLGIEISEQNFKSTGVKAKSGMCKVKGKDLFLIDKNKSVSKKVEILATLLSPMNFENIYILPAIREVLDKYKKSSSKETHRKIIKSENPEEKAS